MSEFADFLKDTQKAFEAAIAKREQRENNPLLRRIEELETDLMKAETSLYLVQKDRAIVLAENRRLFKENNEVKKELRALKQVVDLEAAVERILQRING